MVQYLYVSVCISHLLSSWSESCYIEQLTFSPLICCIKEISCKIARITRECIPHPSRLLTCLFPPLTLHAWKQETQLRFWQTSDQGQSAGKQS